MTRRGHYGFERRRKADLQRAKQEAKRQRKTERAEAGKRPQAEPPDDWVLLTDVEPDSEAQ